MRIVFVSAILLLVFVAIAIILVEGTLTFRNPCDASMAYDFCVPLKKSSINRATMPNQVLDEMRDVNNNQPYIYRQALILSILVSLFMTNFFYVGIPDFKPSNFFYIFFVCFLFNAFVYAFIQFHYYKQKTDVMNYAIRKLDTILQSPVSVSHGRIV